MGAKSGGGGQSTSGPIYEKWGGQSTSGRYTSLLQVRYTKSGGGGQSTSGPIYEKWGGGGGGGSPLQVRYTNSGRGGGGETVRQSSSGRYPLPPLRTPMYSRNQEEPTMMHERVQCTVRNDGILEIYMGGGGGGGGGVSGQRGNNAGYTLELFQLGHICICCSTSSDCLLQSSFSCLYSTTSTTSFVAFGAQHVPSLLNCCSNIWSLCPSCCCWSSCMATSICSLQAGCCLCVLMVHMMASILPQQ